MIVNPTGVFVSNNLRLEVLVDGKGFGVVLSPAEARSLAVALVGRANAIEALAKEADTVCAAAGSDFAKQVGISLD